MKYEKSVRSGLHFPYLIAQARVYNALRWSPSFVGQ